MGGLPASLHVTLTGVSEAGVEDLLGILRASADAVRPLGPGAAPAELVALVAELDFDTLDDAGFAALLPLAGLEVGGESSGRMAGVNRLLDALPVAARELMAQRFLSALYSPYLGG
ncbi:MAG: hypothetical protein HOV87_26860 [Catenulispora sp.]|nr:hypothetical protein [Catenulispora sp.]